MSTHHGANRIFDFVDQWVAAERNEDVEALARLLTDDFVGVGPRGFLLTRDQWLERYRSGDLQHSNFTFNDVQVREYADSAVIVGSQNQQTTFQGRDASANPRATLIAVRPDDHWQLAGAHMCFISPPPA